MKTTEVLLICFLFVFLLFCSSTACLRTDKHAQVRTRSLEDVVLQMKSMAIANVATFPFPSRPDPSAMRSAVKLLLYLGALAPAPSLNVTAATTNAMGAQSKSKSSGEDGDGAVELDSFEDGGEVTGAALSFVFVALFPAQSIAHVSTCVQSLHNLDEFPSKRDCHIYAYHYFR